MVCTFFLLMRSVLQVVNVETVTVLYMQQQQKSYYCQLRVALYTLQLNLTNHIINIPCDSR